jgi:hypothetical protein
VGTFGPGITSETVEAKVSTMKMHCWVQCFAVEQHIKLCAEVVLFGVSSKAGFRAAEMSAILTVMKFNSLPPLIKQDTNHNLKKHSMHSYLQLFFASE